MRFTDITRDAVRDADTIMIAVGTPPKANGEADSSYVEEAAREVAQGLVSGRAYTLVVKSTVPIGSNRRVAHVVTHPLAQRRGERGRTLRVQSGIPPGRLCIVRHFLPGSDCGRYGKAEWYYLKRFPEGTLVLNYPHLHFFTFDNPLCGGVRGDAHVSI